MNSDRTAQLIADGYELVDTLEVGLPHFIWRVDVEVEVDRDLRLVPETVLRLVSAGIGEAKDLAHLMGLVDARMVHNAIVDLLRLGALSHRDDKLTLTPFGVQVLHRAVTREIEVFEDVELRHDPFRDELRWSYREREFRVGRQLRESGLRTLPAPSGLTDRALELRFRDVQALFDRDGPPREDEPGVTRKRDVLRLRPLRMMTAYRVASLEVWYQPTTLAWDWRLMRHGGEEVDVSAKLRELQADGAEIIPFEEQRELALSKKGKVVHSVGERVRETGKTELLKTSEHRNALRDAIFEAKEHLIILSPWLRTAAVDGELLGWLRTALDRTKLLKITIGYGIERAQGKPKDRAAQDQEHALSKLKQLGERYAKRLRTVEIGNTHEKVVICDDRYIIITSFNFLSFNPKSNKGLRRELGHLVRDRSIIGQAKKEILDALEDAQP
ncbi:MAG: hypothetical protein HS108_14410 [Planctomycetes bacterium]|nr:hypothetical protein [Planctomycetota bacterium]